jgi:hypothetical protein
VLKLHESADMLGVDSKSSKNMGAIANVCSLSFCFPIYLHLIPKEKKRYISDLFKEKGDAPLDEYITKDSGKHASK